MPRALSKIEEEYIREHYLTEPVDAIAEKIHGIGPVTIQEYVDTLPPIPEEGETPEARQRKLQSTKVSASKFMGRDPERGVTVMTEAASELIDARATVAVPGITEKRKKKMSNVIHRPFEDSPHDR